MALNNTWLNKALLIWSAFYIVLSRLYIRLQHATLLKKIFKLAPFNHWLTLMWRWLGKTLGAGSTAWFLGNNNAAPSHPCGPLPQQAAPRNNNKVATGKVHSKQQVWLCLTWNTLNTMCNGGSIGIWIKVKTILLAYHGNSWAPFQS